MAGKTLEMKALHMLNTFERAGKTVTSVTIDGRKIELVFLSPDEADEFDKVKMRYDKT